MFIRLSGIKQDEQGRHYFVCQDQVVYTDMPPQVAVVGKFEPAPGEQRIHLVNVNTGMRI